MDHIRIAIRDSTDSMNICFLDNYAGIKFHETTLQRFLKGTCNFLTLKFYGKDIDTIYPGCRLAFKYADNDYWLTINSFEKIGYECSLTAYSLSLETNKEKRKAFKAPTWTFKQYLDYVDPEHSLTLGINEVASQSIQLEWSGTDTILARLFSIANSFGAELEFVTELNDDYSLKRHVLNVYKVGNIGKDKTGMPIRVGKSLKVINYTANIDELYTAIRVHGKDGLTIAGLDKKVYDSDKKLLYYTQGDTLYAPQARDRFPAIAHKASDSFICLESEDTEHSSKEALYAYMLGEIKKHSEPKIDYETEGYVDGEIGDRMLLIDAVHYDPPLYVEARISEQTISLLDKSKNKTVFTNYERKKSEIANELLAKMNALIEENKTYDVQILTTNGYSFKNGFGETTLTARVMDGPKDVTNEFSLTWFKNSAEYAHTASINVQAGSIDELATYLIIAEKDGRERGRNELTVFNVKDGSPGKTPVVHLAWADSSDGSVGFSLELPTDKIPKYRGYYVDYSTVASTNPKLYKWERNPDDAAKVADEAKDKADSADTKADSAVDVANTAKELADKANADATEANRLIGLANGEIDRLNTDVSTAKSDLASAEADLNSKIETVKTTLTQDYATKTNLSDTQITLNKTISESVASVKQEMSETYAVKTDLTTLQGEYNSFKEDTAQKFSQQVSSIQTIQTDTTEAQKLANDAYSKANSAVTSASNASSTANSALSKASDATSVANSASQNASNAVASANNAVSTANTAKSNADKAIADVAALTKTVSSQSTKIDQTSNRIEQVASEVTEVGSNLSNNYYQKTTVDSKLSTAVSGITAQYTQDITTRLGNYYDKSTIDSKLTIDGQGITTYVKNTQSKLDNLQVGGRNLYVHSSGVTFAGDIVNSSTTTKNSEKYGFKSEYKITRLSVVRLQQLQFNGKRHAVVSFNAYVNTGTLDLKVDICDLGNKHFAISTTNNRYSVFVDNINQYNTVDSYNGFSDFEFILAQGQTLYVEYIMVEYATTPSNHSPAHEDMATLTQYTEVKQLADRISSTVYDSASGLVTKTTQLANSYAIKQLNSAGDILTSLNLNANTSTAEIDAKLIRLNGYTKMDDAFINKLVVNSIVTNKIKSTEISGDIIKGGTIDGTIVKSTGSNGTTQLMDGWFISTQNNSIGYYGAQSVNMTIFDTNGYAGSTKLTYGGFLNEMKNSDGVFAKRKITFHAEGFQIEPEDTNVGTNLNSGMHLVGRKAYLDFVANTIHRTDTTPYYLRIIANEDGKSVINSTQGRLEIYTKNQEQLVVNAGYIPQTSMDNNAAVKQMTVAKPNESGTYLEIRNLAGKTWGITMWQSDQRLKDNITASTQDALATINQLQVRQFDWKSDNVHEDFGLIAQEVEQILPNAVFKVGDYYQIKDSGLIPVLIGAVQKLSNKVNLLENIIYNTKGGNLI